MWFLKYILLFIVIISSYIWNVQANINLTVSPIKYEIETTTWSIIEKTAILYNWSDKIHTINTSKSNFISTDKTWNPHFIRQNEIVFPDQELASWITINTESFIIGPGEQKEISFTITVPEDATPWWHYWAVFFKNNNSENSSWWKISINVDYWVLLLVKVDGEIITQGDIKDTLITDKTTGSWWGGWYSDVKIDECKIDLTSSKYDGKCIDDFFEKEDLVKDIKKINLNEDSEITLNDFNINFETLFINEWNTHLKPSWTIKLVDTNWKEIKGIWKEIIKNDAWVIIWEKIVDYLPINDNWWNVLPGTDRNFESEWKGFPYEWYDETWKKIIKYWTPEEYYTKLNIEERWFLLPWERVNERVNHEKINAYIDLSYINKDWEKVEFNSAKEFYVDYKEEYIWLNPYVFIWAWSFLFLIYLIWLIFRKKKIKCINKDCKRKLEDDMKVCPYCGTKQKDKRFNINKKDKK